MPNLFGEDDKTNRFRPRYRELADDEKVQLDAIKAKAEELALLYDGVKNGRYRSLAHTSLEESVMWIVKEITA